jgi:hypothetical protein
VAAGLFLGCTTGTEVETGRTVAAITHGTSDDDDFGVVALTLATHVYCSGTLVSPRVVVTAAHCMTQASARVFFGAAPELGGEFVDVQDVQRPSTFDPSFNASDIAVLRLTWPAPTRARPWPLWSAPFDPTLVGRPVRVIGFGSTDASSPSGIARKRAGASRLSSFSDTDFTVAPDPAQPCMGDSGGPEFVVADGVEQLAGVTSEGDPQCSQFARATRVDAYATTFVRPYLQSVTLGVADMGARCSASTDCTSGTCIAAVDRADFTYCSIACTQSAGCPPGMSCEGGLCRYPLPSREPLDWPCVSDSDCEQGVCARPAAGASASCAQLCNGASRDCGPGHSCLSDANHFKATACFIGAGRGGCTWTNARPSGAAGTLVSLAWLLSRALRRRHRRA